MSMRLTGLKGKPNTKVVAGDRNSIRVLVTKVVKDRVSVGNCGKQSPTQEIPCLWEGMLHMQEAQSLQGILWK